MTSFVTAEEALARVESGNRVFVQGSSQTPTVLLDALAAQGARLRGVEIVSITLQGRVAVAEPELADSFHVNSLFVSSAIRPSVDLGYADYVPTFLSDIPQLFRNGILPLDVALVQVSPPDRHGYCSLGASVDIALTAVQTARVVIAQVNPNVPRTHGDGIIHVSKLDYMVYHEAPLHETSYGGGASEAEEKIGRLIAGMIEDGSCLQMGIGTIPNAVLNCLTEHRDLGVHTEMFSDGLLPLFERGVITNRMKKIHRGMTVSGFAIGTRRLYDFIDDNPSFNFLSIDFVNDPAVIKQNPKMVAINSAIEVDLTGQVCADSIGTRQYSGIGGQMDFIRGAALSPGGKPIIALTSRTAKGLGRIVPFLKPGAGVVTTRGHVHYVVTENGAAYLFGKNLRQRAQALAAIAHPDDRESLERAIHERFSRKVLQS